MGTDSGANSCGVRQWQESCARGLQKQLRGPRKNRGSGVQVERELGSLGSFLIMEPSPPSTG